MEIIKIKMKSMGKVVSRGEIEGMFRKLKKINLEIGKGGDNCVQENIYLRLCGIE
jgi:hypothetical protein